MDIPERTGMATIPMNFKGFIGQLAVCSWSLCPSNPDDLVQKLHSAGLTRVQLALKPLTEAQKSWQDVYEVFAAEGVYVVSGMCQCVGEDYRTLETIRRTGGIVPDSTWAQNLASIEKAAAVANRLGIRLVSLHAGFLPNDPGSPDHAKLRDRIREVADVLAARGITLALETGQETAATLRDFLSEVDRRNVGVNFDPANMILYNQGNPVEALQTLAPWIRQLHIKDAIRPKVVGNWGQEVPVGTGEINWKSFFTALHTIGFEGDLCIEREAGDQRIADIRAAREYIEQLAS